LIRPFLRKESKLQRQGITPENIPLMILGKTNEQVEENLFASSEHIDEGLMILDEIDFLDYSYVTDRINVENLSNNQQN
jgi:hypothetical protein